ncbi:MAG TPA: glycosyltransferase family 39 protein [Solirubrobacteraceae bacterium]|nr:glycosyltransferase family 39 protein [Solirubrobacteraceae bacterium]
MSTTSPELAWRSPRSRRLTFDRTRLRGAVPLAALMALTALLYLWALSRNGWANQYYAAAVQAGTKSWKSFLFGSLDASNYITVDKPPASLWIMELSGRLFGFSSFSMLLPQALEGMAAVALLYAAVRRWFGRSAGLLAGLILALTPVAALMFRFNNPDALLVLLLVAGAYALTRAVQSGATRWLVLCGVALGFAFLTKDLQAFLVLPAFAAAYLVAGPVRLRRRIGQLAAAGGALVASAGWWIALVELWPASARPYIGGSTDNSVLQLIFGYNGLERISSGGGGPGAGFSGPAGFLRLFNAELGGQISWLLPAALIVLGAGAVWTVRRPRTDPTRAALILWGGWLLVSAAVFSFMTGTIHPYYTNTLAAPIAALVGVGAVTLWHERRGFVARLLLAATLVATAAWSFALLDRAPTWHPWLRYAVLIGALLAAGAICAAPRLGQRRRTALALVGVLAALAGPAAYTLSAVASVQTGSNPSAGPTGSDGRFGGGGAGGGGAASSALTSLLEHDASHYTWVAATSSAQNAATLELSTGKPVMALGGFTGSDPAITLARFEQLVAAGKIHYYIAGGGMGGGLGGASGGRPGGASGGGFAGRPGGASGGAPGGTLQSLFGGSDGPPRRSSTTRGPGGFGGPGGGEGQAANREIQSWVEKHFKSSTVGGTTVYNLTQAKAG